VAVTANLPASAYTRLSRFRSVFRRVAANAEQIPGVRSAGVGTDIPLGDWERRGLTIEVRRIAAAAPFRCRRTSGLRALSSIHRSPAIAGSIL